MAKAPTDAWSAADAPGVAKVVFYRPSSYAFRENFRIVDHAGRFVGESVADSYFVVKPPAGEYVFILGDEDIDVLYANLAPGFTYYVRVVPVIGSFAVKAQLRPVRQNDSEWRRLGNDLRRTQLSPMFEKGQTAVDHDTGLHARIDRAKKMWAAFSPEERPGHSLGASDGIPPGAPYTGNVRR